MIQIFLISAILDINVQLAIFLFALGCHSHVDTQLPRI